MTHLTGFPYSFVRRGSRRGASHHKRSATPRAIKWVIIHDPRHWGETDG
jgi:hypothetical protein